MANKSQKAPINEKSSPNVHVRTQYKFGPPQTSVAVGTVVATKGGKGAAPKGRGRKAATTKKAARSRPKRAGRAGSRRSTRAASSAAEASSST